MIDLQYQLYLSAITPLTELPYNSSVDGMYDAKKEKVTDSKGIAIE